MELQQQQRAREAACMRRSRASQRSIRKCLWSVRPPLGGSVVAPGGKKGIVPKKREEQRRNRGRGAERRE